DACGGGNDRAETGVAADGEDRDRQLPLRELTGVGGILLEGRVVAEAELSRSRVRRRVDVDVGFRDRRRIVKEVLIKPGEVHPLASSDERLRDRSCALERQVP